MFENLKPGTIVRVWGSVQLFEVVDGPGPGPGYLLRCLDGSLKWPHFDHHSLSPDRKDLCREPLESIAEVINPCCANCGIDECPTGSTRAATRSMIQGRDDLSSTFFCSFWEFRSE